MAQLQLHWDELGKGCYTEWFTTTAPYAQRDQARLEKRLKSLGKRHIEADLYVGDDRTERVGGVDNVPGTLWNGRTVQWCWWCESGLFEAQVTSVMSQPDFGDSRNRKPAKETDQYDSPTATTATVAHTARAGA